jgi:hypothetical protein
MTTTDNINTGTQGAKRTSWREHNPRDLLLRIRRKNPTADIRESFDFFLEEMEKARNRKYITAIYEYWHTNAFNALTQKEEHDAKLSKEQAGQKLRREATRRAEQKTQRATLDAEADTEINKIIEASLLDFLMPNDKKLRDCTFGYCREVGGWLGRIGAAGKPDQIVGDVLSEDAVRRLRAT